MTGSLLIDWLLLTFKASFSRLHGCVFGSLGLDFAIGNSRGVACERGSASLEGEGVVASVYPRVFR